MASREERMQSRLRGAQRREVKDVDFNFVIPPAAQSQPPSSPGLALSELTSQPTTRLTSASHQAQVSKSVESSERNLPLINYVANDANTSAKRRKLDSDIDAPSSGRSTRSSRNALRQDIYALEQNIQLTPVGDTTNVLINEPDAIDPIDDSITEAAAHIPTSPPGEMPALLRATINEIDHKPNDAPGDGQRVRVIVDSTSNSVSKLQDIQESSPIKLSEDTPKRRTKRKRPESSLKPPDTSLPTSKSSHQVSPIQDSDELSPEQPVRRGRKPKAAVADDSSIREESTVELDHQEEAEAIDDEQAAITLQRIRGRRVSRNNPVVSSSQDMENQQIPVPKSMKSKLQQNSSPAKQRHPRTKPKPQQQAPTRTSKKAKLRAGSPIPVTVHRLTRPLVYEEDHPDADILNAEIVHTKRGGVNAIDVLSQICQEIVDAGLETLELGGANCDDAALRREYKTKWRAVEVFGQELQARLLEHTINLDNGYSLERRLRDEHKKKLGLREEILHVRAERQQTALHMDEIRMNHEREKEEALDRDALNIAVHDIELAVDMGRNHDPHDTGNDTVDLMETDFLLRRVAEEVSTKSDSGGMLRHIKEFNAFLERAASALEGRKS